MSQQVNVSPDNFWMAVDYTADLRPYTRNKKPRLSAGALGEVSAV
jgi:hypothetical protein